MGMKMLQSIYKLFWTDLLKQLRGVLGWKRILKDICGCYFQASRLVKFVNDVVSTYLLCSYLHCHYDKYANGLIHHEPADLLRRIAVDYHSFLIQSGRSTDEHLRMIVYISNVSSVCCCISVSGHHPIKSGDKWFAPIWRILGQVKY
jgi:hypothetical protein